MGGQWRLVKPESLAPAPRGAHASVALGTKVLVFGGADRAPVPFNDLWVLETADGKYEWTRISPVMAAGCKLLPRSGATLTAVGDRVYLFGGTEPVSGVCFNEIKVLDPLTWSWSDVEAHGTLPPARHSHCSGCLADTCLIVYGGAGYQGPMQDLWIFNTLQGSWSRPAVSGAEPAAREMHTGVMVEPTTLLVYGGRGANFKVCCDAALFDARQMKWAAIEPTPFSRCAHTAVVLPGAGGHGQGDTSTLNASTTYTAAADTRSPGEAGSESAVATAPGSDPGTSWGLQQQREQSRNSALPAGDAAAEPGVASSSNGDGGSGCGGGSSSSSRVLIYGGYSGEAVEGDVLQIDSRTLEIEVVRRGPRESDIGGSVPSVRFAHSAVVVPGEPSRSASAAVEAGVGQGAAASNDGTNVGLLYTMVVFGGVNPKEDLNDLALWVCA